MTFIAIKSLFFVACLLSLSGCIMVVRKGIGQLRGTETEITAGPIPVQFDDVQYNVLMDIAPDADKLIGKEATFVDLLQKDFSGQKMTFLYVKNTNHKAHSTPVANDPRLKTSSINFKFNEINRSWLLNQLTLTGEIIIKDGQHDIRRSFTVTTHKTFDVAERFLDSLSESLSQCVIDEKSQQGLSLSKVVQP